MELFFNKKLYNKEAIKKASKAYNNLADFKIIEKNNKIKVKLSNIDSEVKKVIADEFSNYALALMQELNSREKNE